MSDVRELLPPVNGTGYTDSPTLRTLNAELSAGINLWHKHDTCYVCNAHSLATFSTIRYFPYSRCRNCGFTFANPHPPEAILHNFYNSPFYNNYRRVEARRITREHYFSISMYTDMRRLASWLGEVKPQTILDYGCGPGAFLALLRDEFGLSHVEGFEINRASRKIAQSYYGLDIVSSTEELQHESYDCLILIELIEHVPNPGAFFERIAELVKPGGYLLITTPAIDNVLGRFFPSQCPHYTPPSHVSLFTKQALTHLLARFGFSVERIEIDECTQVLERLTRGLFYDLDFASPRHDDDLNDALFVPKSVGRLLRLKSHRSPDLFRRALASLDRLFIRLARRLPGLSMNDHFYVLARKGRIDES